MKQLCGTATEPAIFQKFKYLILTTLVNVSNHIAVSYDLNNDGSLSLFPKSELLEGSNCP